MPAPNTIYVTLIKLIHVPSPLIRRINNVQDHLRTIIRNPFAERNSSLAITPYQRRRQSRSALQVTVSIDVAVRTRAAVATEIVRTVEKDILERDVRVDVGDQSAVVGFERVVDDAEECCRADTVDELEGQVLIIDGEVGVKPIDHGATAARFLEVEG